MGRTVAVFSLVVLIPLVGFAQADDALRAQIRADLVQDPRSAQMTDEEIDALVLALAEEAEASGVSGEYLEAQSTFEYAALFPPPEAVSSVGGTFLSPLILAIALLVFILGAVIWYIARRGKNPAQ